MNALAKTPDAGGQVIQANAASLMEVISRAASDPNTDVDKLERLLGMYERITAQNARVAYAAALAELQPKLPVIDRRGLITVPAKAGSHDGHSTPYARWEDINDAIRPLLHDHGFALSFRIGQAQDGKITVSGVLSHREGHQEETTITLMHDSSGSKNAVQAVGSSISYGKRYTAMGLLNITSRAPGEADDDGHAGDPAHWISAEQVKTLSDLMEEAGADRAGFLNYFKIGTLSHLPTARFGQALSLLAQKKAKTVKGAGHGA